MAFALQLHKDLDYDPLRKKGQAKLSFVDREIRRRVMWSCFLMDRFNSSGTDRPMFITPDVIETPLPVKERHFLLDMPAVTEKLDGSLPSDSLGGVNAAGDAAENLGVSAFIIRTVALWGRITTYVNQGGITSDLKPMSDETSGFTKLVREAEALLHGLPEALHYSSDNISLHQIHHTANQFLLLHLILQQNMLFLFRTAISVTSGGGRPDDGFMANARSRALEAAARISDILRDAEESRVVISAPVAGYCAFSSTSMHIRVILSGHPANKATAETNAATNIRFLRKIMKFWGMFHWMEEDVRTQYRRALDRSRSGLPPDDSEAAAPILQYGDWFSRYPHGVSDSDFNDPASQQKKREKGADGVLEQKPELHSVEEFFTMLASPKGSDKQQQQQQQQSAAKRKATGKKVVGPSADKVPAPKATTLAQKKNRPPALETVGVQSMTPGPESTHLHQQAQLQQPQARRPSVPLGSQTAGTPSPFHNPFTSSHPQAPTTYTMSPISPVNQFTPGNVAATSAAGPHPPPPPPQQQQPQPQPQQQFFPANMMHQHMGMAPQPQPQQMGPLDQTLSFGGYPMDPHAHHQGQQHIMGPTWHDAAPPGSNGGQQTAHQPQQNGLGDMDHHHAHAHAQAHVPGGNGLGPDGWFVTPDMQSADAFAGMFGGGMHQNPLGGLRHAQ